MPLAPGFEPRGRFIAITHVDSWSLGPPSQVCDLAPPRRRGPGGHPAVPRASRRLRRRATQGPAAPGVAAVVTSFACAKAVPVLAPTPQPRPGVSGALWIPPWASPASRRPSLRAGEGEEARSSPGLHFASAKYDNSQPLGPVPGPPIPFGP